MPELPQSKPALVSRPACPRSAARFCRHHRLPARLAPRIQALDCAEFDLAGLISAQHYAVNAAVAVASRATPQAAPPAPGRGTELGLATGFDARYEMGALLGVGSFGTVHQAVDRASGREVAVKLLRKDLPRGMHPTRGTGRSALSAASRLLLLCLLSATCRSADSLMHVTCCALWRCCISANMPR